MKISFNTTTPMIYDFLRVISFKQNEIDFINEYAGAGLIVENRVPEAIDYLWESLDHEVPGVALFFHKNGDKRNFMDTKYCHELHEFEDVNELIADVFEGPIDQLQLDILRFYDDEENTDTFYTNLISDKKKTYAYISSLNLPVICKWELTGIIENPEEVLEPLKLFCHRVKRKLKNVYKNNGDFIKGWNKEMAVKIKNNSDFLFGSELKCLFGKDYRVEEKDIIVTYSLINEFLTYTYSSDNKLYFILGVGYLSAMNCSTNRDRADIFDSFLKAFSDKHRMTIFRLLMDKEMYVGQIANELDLVLSTTSYHLDILLSARILSGRSEGKRVYYTVNNVYVTDKFSEIIDSIDDSTF